MGRIYPFCYGTVTDPSQGLVSGLGIMYIDVLSSIF